MLQLAILLLTIVAAVSSLPPKGCASCFNTPEIPVRQREHAGSMKIEKTLDSNGCFVQKTTCTPQREEGFSFLQINYGESGLGKQGVQTVELYCNNYGEWTLEQKGKLVVHTLSCHST